MPRRRRVAVIGDGRVTSDHPRWAIALELGGLLVERGHHVITGGRAGVMEAACRGARESPGWFEGATVGILPGTDPCDANPYVDLVLPTGLGHARNAVVAQSDAVIAVGGGAGTLSELAFAWVHGRLVIGLRCGGWSERLAGGPVDERVRLADPALAAGDQVFGSDTARGAIEVLDRLLEPYCSARLVNDREKRGNP